MVWLTQILLNSEKVCASELKIGNNIFNFHFKWNQCLCACAGSVCRLSLIHHTILQGSERYEWLESCNEKHSNKISNKIMREKKKTQTSVHPLSHILLPLKIYRRSFFLSYVCVFSACILRTASFLFIHTEYTHTVQAGTNHLSLDKRQRLQ